MLRLSLLTWNPLEVNCKDLEKMEWYETVMRYGFKPDETEAQLLDDPDIRLVPTLIEKIVLPKITGDLLFQYHFFFNFVQIMEFSNTITIFQNIPTKHGIRCLLRKHFDWRH